MKARELAWTPEQPPGPGCPYNHTTAPTPMGAISIEWKGWKESDSFTVFFPWGDKVLEGDTLGSAKAVAQTEWETLIASCLE